MANATVEVKVGADLTKFDKDVRGLARRLEKDGLDINFKAGKGAKDLFSALQKQVGELSAGKRVGMIGTAAKLGAGAAKEGGAGMLGQMGGAITGITTMLGPIVTGILGILGLVLTFKPIIKMISLIGKMLMEFLRPIANVVLVLLAPILAILRPIMKIWQAMMMPYMKKMYTMISVGMKSMQAGEMGVGMEAFGVAMLYALKPLVDVISYVQQGLMTVIVKAMFMVAKVVTTLIDEIFGTNITEKVAGFQAEVQTDINNFFEATRLAGTLMIDKLALAVTNKAVQAGVNVKREADTLSNIIIEEIAAMPKEAKTAVEKYFPGLIGSVVTEIGNLVKAVEDNFDITTGTNKIASSLKKLQDTINSFSAGGGKMPGSKEWHGGIWEDYKKRPEFQEGQKSRGRLSGESFTGGGSSLLEQGSKFVKGAFDWIKSTSQQAGRVSGYGRSSFNDFIIRPGQPPQSFSSQDTVVGFKGGKMPGGGGGNNITINVNAAINSDMDLKRLASQLAENLNTEMQRRSSY